MENPLVINSQIDNIVYYEWTHRVEGSKVYSLGHIASPFPFNERYDVIEIPKDEYEKAIARADRDCE